MIVGANCLAQRVENRLRVNAEQECSGDHDDDGEASEWANDNFASRGRSYIPVNGEDYLEVIVKAGANRYDGDDNESEMVSRNGGVENKEYFPAGCILTSSGMSYAALQSLVISITSA